MMRPTARWSRLTVVTVAVATGALALACSAAEPTAKPTTAAAPPAAAKPAAADKNVLLAAIPNAPPRATATPLPAGAVPPAPPAPPAPEKVDVFLYVDTVTAGNGESKLNLDPNRNCAITGVIKRGMHLVFRMKGVDVTTAKTLTTENVKDATVRIPGQEDRKMRFAKHADDWHWGGAAWDVPADYPLGAVDFTVEVTTVDGKKGLFKQMAIGDSRLQVIE